MHNKDIKALSWAIMTSGTPVGEVKIAKNGYIMAHYAQYATGTTRIKAVTNNTGICATAYINETGNEVTVVLLNFKKACIEILLAGMKHANAVESNENKNMEVISTEMLESGRGVDATVVRHLRLVLTLNSKIKLI